MRKIKSPLGRFRRTLLLVLAGFFLLGCAVVGALVGWQPEIRGDLLSARWLTRMFAIVVVGPLLLTGLVAAFASIPLFLGKAVGENRVRSGGARRRRRVEDFLARESTRRAARVSVILCLLQMCLHAAIAVRMSSVAPLSPWSVLIFVVGAPVLTFASIWMLALCAVRVWPQGSSETDSR